MEDYLRKDINDSLQRVRDSLRNMPEEIRKLATASADNLEADSLPKVADLLKVTREQAGWLSLSVLMLNIMCHEKEEGK